jgi:hypothetical protein
LSNEVKICDDLAIASSKSYVIKGYFILIMLLSGILLFSVNSLFAMGNPCTGITVGGGPGGPAGAGGGSGGGGTGGTSTKDGPGGTGGAAAPGGTGGPAGEGGTVFAIIQCNF